MHVCCAVVLQVRGAPLIAIVAALGLAVEAGRKYPTTREAGGAAAGGVEAAAPLADAAAAAAYLLDRMQYLRTSRPTAVRVIVTPPPNCPRARLPRLHPISAPSS